MHRCTERHKLFLIHTNKYFNTNKLVLFLHCIKCPDSKSEPIIPRHHRRNVQNLRHQTLLRRGGVGNSQSSRADDDLDEVSALGLFSYLAQFF